MQTYYFQIELPQFGLLGFLVWNRQDTGPLFFPKYAHIWPVPMVSPLILKSHNFQWISLLTLAYARFLSCYFPTGLQELGLPTYKDTQLIQLGF